ncbi:hypothetical protein DOY81_000688 [Sarcophaga bullata]|nr:hypothetical protein DOY81_000688 [Sarcophaga bullata]
MDQPNEANNKTDWHGEHKNKKLNSTAANDHHHSTDEDDDDVDEYGHHK